MENLTADHSEQCNISAYIVEGSLTKRAPGLASNCCTASLSSCADATLTTLGAFDGDSAANLQAHDEFPDLMISAPKILHGAERD